MDGKIVECCDSTFGVLMDRKIAEDWESTSGIRCMDWHKKLNVALNIEKVHRYRSRSVWIGKSMNALTVLTVYWWIEKSLNVVRVLYGVLMGEKKKIVDYCDSTYSVLMDRKIAECCKSIMQSIDG
jgi:hypothetical protein